jgi:glycosyl transferase family 25
MKCVVINLPDSTARWEAMADQLAGWPFPVTRFEAIDGLRLNAAEVAALYSPSRNRRQYPQPLTPGEIGCYASHLAIWRAFLASDEPCRAVFEDDLTLHPELIAVLRAVNTLAVNWGMLKLIGRSKEKIARSQPWIPGHCLIRYRRVPIFSSAYVISRRGAQQLLSAHVPFGRPGDIDMRYWWESGCSIIGVQPYPVTLSAFSDHPTIAGRSGAWSFSVKLRRMFLKTDYNLRNWRANRRLARTRQPLGPTFLAGTLTEKTTTTVS